MNSTYTVTVTTNENTRIWTQFSSGNEAWRAAWDYATTQISVGREITGITVEPEASSATEADSWQLHQQADGTQEYRRLVLEERPARRRFARIFVHPDGQIFGQSAQGYMRKYASVEEAQQRLNPAGSASRFS